MLVTVTFEEYGKGKTKLILVHEGMPTSEDKEGAFAGWNESFDKMSTLLKRSVDRRARRGFDTFSFFEQYKNLDK